MKELKISSCAQGAATATAACTVIGAYQLLTRKHSLDNNA